MLEQSTGSWLNFHGSKRIHEAEIECHETMKFDSKLVFVILTNCQWDICPLREKNFSVWLLKGYPGYQTLPKKKFLSVSFLGEPGTPGT